jgi:hypothetical protein
MAGSKAASARPPGDPKNMWLEPKGDAAQCGTDENPATNAGRRFRPPDHTGERE